MEEMTPKIYAIVVTYKGKEWYDRCFGSLVKSEVPLQVIAVNNSPDDTELYLAERFPMVKVISSHGNIGFGQANNLGIRYAMEGGADYLFLLNQDAWIEPDTIGKLLRISEIHTDYGILGCMNLTKEKDHLLYGFIPMIADPANCDRRLIDDMYFGRMKDVYEIKDILAAAWWLPVSTVHTVGGFDPLFPHYGEDNNYQQRVLYHGLKIGVCPHCPIVHDTVVRTDCAIRLREGLYAFERNLKLEWLDINKNFHPLRIFLRELRRCAKFALKGDYGKANRAWRAMMLLCREVGSVSRHRKLYRTTGELFL